jgi:hypothetical protein
MALAQALLRNSPRLAAATFLSFVAVAGAFYLLSWHTGSQARAIAALPACRTAVSHQCVATFRAQIVDRYTDGQQQHILVFFASNRPSTPTKTDVQLSSDGWGGKWRGHFAVGEQVRIRYRSTTPLMVLEQDGHHRLTADHPSSDSSVFFVMTWVFLGGSPFVTLLILFLYGRWPSPTEAESALGAPGLVDPPGAGVRLESSPAQSREPFPRPGEHLDP